MDDRGFVFTSDASLALVVLIVFTASIVTYYMAPFFMGQDHQHLQALASDALETMEKDGTLYLAAAKYQANDTVGANQIINDRLQMLIPADTAYNLNMMGNDVRDDKGIIIAKDTATAVRVISGPREGWLGRAWYKVEEVRFEDEQINVTSTVWNFHNYLGNFAPWNSNGFYNRQYWGVSGSSRPGSPVNIPFSIPQDATITGAYFLQGTNNRSATNLSQRSYAVDVNINGHHYYNTTPFTTLYPRVDAGGNFDNGLVYNYRGIINPADLNPGNNNYFNVYFNYLNLLRSNYNYDMPWFALIANYTTSIRVPVGILSQTVEFDDAAGLAKPNNAGGYYGKIYDLSSGSVTNLTTRREMNWNTYASNKNTLDNYDDGIPFVITNVPGVSGTGHGSAVSIVKDVIIPSTGNVRILDGYVNINTYGGVDNALVEVWNGTAWQTAFCSFNFDGKTYSSRTDGYGNTPGIIYIGDKLRPGSNKVRITVWDHVPSNDYDLVGLVDCKVFVSYTRWAIKWDNFAFDSYQAGSAQTYTFPDSTNGRSFSIGPDATKVYLFVGAGTTSKHIRVDVRNATSSWYTLYDSDTIPYSLDIASLDAGSNHVFTTGTAANYTLKQGTGYRLRVTITAPPSWQSGDGGTSPGTYGNPTIFSGTRIAVIYPKFLQNTWATSYNSTAQAAQAQARMDLINVLAELGITPDPNLIKTEALYTGDLPNSIPVRLDLWME